MSGDEQIMPCQNSICYLELNAFPSHQDINEDFGFDTYFSHTSILLGEPYTEHSLIGEYPPVGLKMMPSLCQVCPATFMTPFAQVPDQA